MSKWLIATLIGLVSFLAPIKLAAHCILALVSMDFLTGLWKAKKLGDPITSAKMRRTLSKALIYIIALIGALCVEKLADVDFVIKWITSIIGFIEGKSLLENLDAVNGSPIFKTIIKKLGSKNDEEVS